MAVNIDINMTTTLWLYVYKHTCINMDINISQNMHILGAKWGGGCML